MTNKRSPRREPQLWFGAMIVILTWIGIEMLLNVGIFAHEPHDSYTLQALAWRKGMLSLGQNYPWLELAIFNGDYYVSFPSVPALVMLPLTFLFGENTPNTLITGLYFLGSYFAAYALARRFRKAQDAQFMALFMTLGCNMLQFSLLGGVWNQAQLLSFLLTTLCALGLTGESPAEWGVGLGCLALSVGCRPFQAVYVPFGLWMLYQNLNRRSPAPFFRTLLRMIPYLIFPALVALALGWYNWARFGNPIEFGHNYLPEFTRDPDQPQMGAQYILNNLRNLLRLPYFEENRLAFPMFDGFAFYLANPIYATAFVALIIKLLRRRFDWGDGLLCAGFMVEILMLLCHKTFGGWQFGARYLCDLIPMLMLFQLRGRTKRAHWETAVGLFAIAFNIYGAILFHLTDLLA